ncbi:MAG: alpha/beta fold hydrolase, partial [Lysobacterales bacterium]
MTVSAQGVESLARDVQHSATSGSQLSPMDDRYQNVSAGGIRWNYRRSDEASGDKPKLLLLHGTGAGIHSWDGLWRVLEHHFQLLAPDLPGHCASVAPDNWRPGLEPMASALRALLNTTHFSPDLVVGHSAGAALAAQLALDEAISPRALIAINGAFMPYGGPAAS